MKAFQLLDSRIAYSEEAFAQLMIRQLPKPVPSSRHRYKYRLAYVVSGHCVLRYDNEAGKGDHRHRGKSESVYLFVSVEKLLADFKKDIARWNDENSHS